MHVTPQQGTGAVVLGDEIDAVVGQVGDDAGQGGLTQASYPVVGQAVGRAGFVGAGQLVVEVIGVSPDSVAAQVAVGVVAQRAAGGGGVLVQAVAGVAAGAVGVTGPLVAVVRPAGRLDVLHLVAGVAPGVVLGGAGQVLGQAG